MKTTFVIPTYRDEAVQTAQIYDQNFTRHGREANILILDDARNEYYFQQIHLNNPAYYVGEEQKEQTRNLLVRRLTAGAHSADKTANVRQIVNNTFRDQSYGGNRNFSVLYSMGGLLVSSDDDMRPYKLQDNQPASLTPNQVSWGRLQKSSSPDYTKIDQDVLGGFQGILGKKVSEASQYPKSKYLIDSDMDLFTNASTGLSDENTLTLSSEAFDKSSNATILMAQTFRSGTNDIDQIDYVNFFLRNPDQNDFESLNDIFVLGETRQAVTAQNWRMDCGVAGYYNMEGIPAFFSTQFGKSGLRMEDYGMRLYMTDSRFASAQLEVAQTHIKHNTNRPPLCEGVLNEHICVLMKNMMRQDYQTTNCHLEFGGDFSVKKHQSDEILDEMQKLHTAVKAEQAKTRDNTRYERLGEFASNAEIHYEEFDPSAFNKKLNQTVQAEITTINQTQQIWPQILEICHDPKTKLPIKQLGNQP